MKTKLITLLSALLIGVACAEPNGKALIPAEPIGILTAYPTKVPYDPLRKNEPSAHVQLNWNIIHPAEIGDVALIIPPGLIYLKEGMYVSVQCIGVNPLKTKNVEASISINGQAYRQLFYGTTLDVSPKDLLYSKKLNKFDTIALGLRYGSTNWGEFNTSKRDITVRAFRNGDVLPMVNDTYVQNFASFVQPVCDAGGKVTVGPLSILILADLSNDPVLRYRDAAFLITLSSKNQNNGHGNNLDGIDPSNPGKGMGGPTGQKNTGTYEDIELK